MRRSVRSWSGCGIAARIGDPGRADGAAAVIPLPDVDEQVGPVLQILPLQQLAHAVAVARGHDPDAPRGLAKVTLTR